MACSICRHPGHDKRTCVHRVISCPKVVPKAVTGDDPLEINPSAKGKYVWVSGHVEYDYDTSYSCGESGCNDDAPCTCGTIQNGRVTEVYYNNIVNDVGMTNRPPKDSEEKLVLLALYKGLRPGDFEVYGEAGYYGDEVEVRYESTALALFQRFNTEPTLLGKLGVALKYEYGFLPEWYPLVKELTVRVVPTKMLMRSNQRLNPETLRGYITSKHTSGIIVKQTLRGYEVVDGNHRTQTAVELGLEETEVIVLSLTIPVQDILVELRNASYHLMHTLTVALNDGHTAVIATGILSKLKQDLAEV